MTIKTKTNSLIGTGLKCGIYGGILGGVAGGNLYVLSGLPLHMLIDIWEVPVVNPLIALIGYAVFLALATVVGGLFGLPGGVIGGFIAALISLARGPSTISWSRLGAVLGV